ncbi:MAG: hypothetical protein AW07_00714 [Candidatus Accumulibacter sp. SK-11]|nr:MAG: hypothetical protein AW07_00714 [Candidatus Accumulibacter sp. SK-11]
MRKRCTACTGTRSATGRWLRRRPSRRHRERELSRHVASRQATREAAGLGSIHLGREVQARQVRLHFAEALDRAQRQVAPLLDDTGCAAGKRDGLATNGKLDPVVVAQPHQRSAHRRVEIDVGRATAEPLALNARRREVGPIVDAAAATEAPEAPHRVAARRHRIHLRQPRQEVVAANGHDFRHTLDDESHGRFPHLRLFSRAREKRDSRVADATFTSTISSSASNISATHRGRSIRPRAKCGCSAPRSRRCSAAGSGPVASQRRPTLRDSDR